MFVHTGKVEPRKLTRHLCSYMQNGLGCGQCYVVSCVPGDHSKSFCKAGSSVLVS